ncbi:MFS transporter [Sediminibacillus albus]|uniref:Transmembrane secretion effector n=1 Tax=Sediminibacillus albus TaxID=407036 RepID=A0A1G9ALV9_9BACI|nr:MFS transporter [Sediminibacillus albus]SDK27515.1 Transmembrane secretion effector [Sediminibacillus albus]
MDNSAISLKRDSLPPLSKNYSVFRFIGGNLISFIGDQIYLIALPLMVLAITGSPVSMGIVTALERLPVLLQPATGILSDRFNRKKILLACDAGRCLLTGWIAVLFMIDSLQAWELYMAAFFIGLSSQIYHTSQFASVPNLVRNEDLQAVNSVNTGLFQTAVLAGPSLGGLIISLFNPGYALLINSFSFLIAFSAVATITFRPGHAPVKQKTVFQDIKEGFHFVIKVKPIFFTNLAMFFSTFGTTLFLTLLVFHLKDVIQLSANQIGWLLSAGGIGAIGGALSTNLLSKYFSYRSILFTASFIGGLSILLFSYAQSYVLLMIANAIGTFAASIMSPCIVTIRQVLTPSRMLGRVQATSRFMTWTLMPAAALLAGILANITSTAATIQIGGIISTLASFIYLHHSLKNKRSGLT